MALSVAAEAKETPVAKSLPTQGAPTALSAEDEDHIRRYCASEAMMQRSVNTKLIREIVGDIFALRRQQRGLPPKEWKPGHKWVIGFRRRMAQAGTPLCSKRAKRRNGLGPTRRAVDGWLTALGQALIDIGLLGPECKHTAQHVRTRIINLDETGVNQYAPNKLQVLVPRDCEGAVGMTDKKFEHLTLVGAVDADGGRMPPFIIMKGKRTALDLQNVLARTLGTPPDTGWACSTKGWITTDIWWTVLRHIVAFKQPTAENPIIIIADCHSTRYAVKALKWASDHHCHVFTLLPNATGIMQPLDVSVYGPFKRFINQLMEELLAAGKKLSKVTLPKLICDAWERAATVTNIQAGWRNCGMGVINDKMSTRGMASDRFAPESITSRAAAGSSADDVIDLTEDVKSNEWKAPADLAHVLRHGRGCGIPEEKARREGI